MGGFRNCSHGACYVVCVISISVCHGHEAGQGYVYFWGCVLDGGEVFAVFTG